MNDNELKDLFSAFDEVSATDDLKAATLDRIMAMAQTAPVSVADQEDCTEKLESASAEDSIECSAGESASASEANAVKSAASVKAVRTGSRARAKWRAIRVAAVAACLALALTGGVAYATPTSHVLVTQGATTIELGVNPFGITVEAKAYDDEGQRVIDGVNLTNMSLEDAISCVSDSLKSSNPGAPVEVIRDSERVAQAMQSKPIATSAETSAVASDPETGGVPSAVSDSGSASQPVAADSTPYAGGAAVPSATSAGVPSSPSSGTDVSVDVSQYNPTGVVGRDSSPAPAPGASSGDSGFIALPSDGMTGGTVAEDSAVDGDQSSGEIGVGGDDGQSSQGGDPAPQIDDDNADEDQPPSRYNRQDDESFDVA